MATDETRIEHGTGLPLLHADVTEQVIGAAFEVHRLLGFGFLEKVYQRALQAELNLRGMIAELEREIRVQYKGVEVGYYKADVLVRESVIVEIKVAKRTTQKTRLSY